MPVRPTKPVKHYRPVKNRNSQVVRQWEVLKLLARRDFVIDINFLAKKTKVHTRTIKRDLAALRSSGFLEDVVYSKSFVKKVLMHRMRVAEKNARKSRNVEYEKASRSFMGEVMEVVNSVPLRWVGTQAENIQDAVKKGRHPSQIYPGIRRKNWRSTEE